MSGVHEGEVCEADEKQDEPRHETEPATTPAKSSPGGVDRMVSTVGGPPMQPRPIVEQLSSLRWTWPSTLELDAELGGRRERTVEVWNDDNVPRSVFSTYVNGSSAFTVSKAPAIVPARSSAKITVAFTPRTNVVETATLFIAPDRGVGASMPLVGRVIPKHEEPVKPVSPPARAIEAPHSQTGELLTAPPSKVDWGEQVTGSHEFRRVGVPFNLSQQPAIASFKVEGSAFTLLSTRTLTLSPSGQMNMNNWEHNSPLIQFAPNLGKNTGKLTTTVVWGDGTTRQQVVELVGRGRLPSDAPSAPESTPQEIAAQRAHDELVAKERSAEEKAIAKDQKRTDPYPQNAKNDLDSIAATAETNAEGLARAQARALRTIEREATAYSRVKTPEEGSLWKALLEISLNLATAGIASQLAKNLLPALLSRLAGQEGVAKLSEFTTEVVKDGLKTAGKHAVKLALADEPAQRETDDKAPDDSVSSGNARVEFFRLQEKAHDKQATLNKTVVQERVKAMRPLLRSDPAKAIAVIETLASRFAAEAEFADKEQSRVTAALWAANVAHRSQGTEEAGKGMATKLDAARVITKKQMPSPRDGLLDIVLERGTAMPRVVSARMTGVSAEIGTRLLRQPLKDYPIPVRFVLNANDAKPTIVTRDELKRVRVSGDVMYFARFSSSSIDRRDAANWENMKGYETPEAEGIAGATFIVEQILSSPLTAWGISHIAHDDATGLNG